MRSCSIFNRFDHASKRAVDVSVKTAVVLNAFSQRLEDATR